MVDMERIDTLRYMTCHGIGFPESGFVGVLVLAQSPFPGATLLRLCEEQVTTLQAKLAACEQMKSNEIV